MCLNVCTGFTNFMFKGKSLTDFTNLFSPHKFKKNFSKWDMSINEVHVCGMKKIIQT